MHFNWVGLCNTGQQTAICVRGFLIEQRAHTYLYNLNLEFPAGRHPHHNSVRAY